MVSGKPIPNGKSGKDWNKSTHPVRITWEANQALDTLKERTGKTKRELMSETVIARAEGDLLTPEEADQRAMERIKRLTELSMEDL